MKKLIIVSSVVIMILTMAGIAKASVTYVETVAYDTGYFLDQDDNKYNSPYYRWHDEDWSWTHTFSPTPAAASIISAKLEIMAWDVNGDEVNLIKRGLGGADLGSLDTGHGEGSAEPWHITIFDFTGDSAAIADLMDGTLDIWMDIDSTYSEGSPAWAVTLDWSKLTVTYEPIPAPGAILLGGIGIVLVGWLRRRRTL